MDVFALRDRVIDDYSSYVRSFFSIRDQGIRAFVDQMLAYGRLWPDPLVQLNPSYESGGTIDALVGDGLLHPECARIFRRSKEKDLVGALSNVPPPHIFVALTKDRSPNFSTRMTLPTTTLPTSSTRPRTLPTRRARRRIQARRSGSSRSARPSNTASTGPSAWSSKLVTGWGSE